MHRWIAAIASVFLFAAATSVMAANPKVEMETDEGTLIIELYPEQAPKTVENFLAYVEDGFYNGTIFHRIVPGFVIQGGGYTFDFQEKETREPIVNESDNGLKNTRGTLSMARLPNPDSATSQFFINLADNPNLDYVEGKPGYAVFGKVVEGMDVVDKIAAAPTGNYSGRFAEAPNTPIRMLKVKLIEE